MTQRKIGTVKWFNIQKGFGFILPDEGGKDVFVHITDVERAELDHLPEKKKIEYELMESRGRSKAVNLRLLD